MPRSENVFFPGHAGVKLAGIIQWPEAEPKAWALFAHCFTCGKDFKAAVRVCQALAELGIATLRFDFMGIGQSEGEFADAGFNTNVRDLVAAAGWLREHYEAPQMMIGHSLGGAATLIAAPSVEECKAVVTIGAPSDTHHLKKTLGGLTSADFVDSEHKDVDIAGRRFTVSRDFVHQLEQNTVTDKLEDLHKALLILHSPTDDTVGIEHAGHIFKHAKHPKSFVSLDHADHLLTHPEDARYVALTITSWASRYLELDQHHVPSAAKFTEQGEVCVTIGREHYATQVLAGNHRLTSDEPESLGGKDLGPTPYEYLLAALGNCTAITLRMYADRKELPLERAIVTLRHHREGEKDAQVSVIKRTISLVGELSTEDRKRLMEIADRCPVHKTLTGSIRVETQEQLLDESACHIPGVV